MENGKVTHIQLSASDWADINARVAAAKVRADERAKQWRLFLRGVYSYAEYEQMAGITLAGEDEVGMIAINSDGRRFYLTPCCGASAKGLEDGVGCRNCYQLIDPRLGGIPADPDLLERLAQVREVMPAWAKERAAKVVSEWMAAGMNFGLLADVIAEALAEAHGDILWPSARGH